MWQLCRWLKHKLVFLFPKNKIIFWWHTVGFLCWNRLNPTKCYIHIIGVYCLKKMFSYLRITENDLNLVFPYTKFKFSMNIVDKRTNFLLMTTIQTIFYHNLWRVKTTKSAFLHKNLNFMLRAGLLKRSWLLEFIKIPVSFVLADQLPVALLGFEALTTFPAIAIPNTAVCS